MSQIICFLKELSPLIAWISFFISIGFYIRDYLKRRAKIEIGIIERYFSSTFTIQPVKRMLTFSIVISNNSTNPISIVSIRLSDEHKTIQTFFDKLFIQFNESSRQSLSGEMLWNRDPLFSTLLPFVITPLTSELINFRIDLDEKFLPSKAVINTDKKDFQFDSIALSICNHFRNNQDD